MEPNGESPRAKHLCVIVHGLWGNPNHVKNIAKALQDQFPRDELHVHLAKRNSGGFTYDGIELGGERVCAEIIEELEAFENNGGKITKLSIVGYSLGGLISRYAVGLLYARGVLDSIECMNFVTFASPHLGTRSPLKGWLNYLWNFLGARTVSVSGQQLFLIDDFHNTGRPILSVMTDDDSIFIKGLRLFKRRSLYSNIINDRTTVYYTTCIEKTDPFKKLDQLDINFVEGYEGLILDAADPPTIRPRFIVPASLSSATTVALGYLRSVPLILAVSLLLPIGIFAFLLNSAYQTVLSSRRIRLHTEQIGLKTGEYRVPLLIKELRGGVDHAYEVLSNAQDQAFLGSDDDDYEDATLNAAERSTMARERRLSIPAEPTLALAPSQFEMIRSLNALNWRKYPIWIQSHRHTHAAIIVRTDKKSFAEGWLVLKHFAANEFLI